MLEMYVKHEGSKVFVLKYLLQDAFTMVPPFSLALLFQSVCIGIPNRSWMQVERF